MNPKGGPGRGVASAPDAVLDSPASHGHTVQFYGDDGFLADATARFIGAALGAGGAGVVLATPAHRVGIGERLRAQGVDLTAAERQGRYVALDAAEMLARCLRNGEPDAARFAELIGGIIARATAAVPTDPPRVAVFGELVALLSADGRHEHVIQLEHLWNDLAVTQAFDLRCAYPITAFSRTDDAEPLARICAAHARVIPVETYAALIADAERDRTITFLQQQAQALSTEIEQRKQAQLLLQRREADLADFLENALEGVQQVGPDCVIRWANRAMLKLLGFASAEYVGHPLGDFYADPPTFQAFWTKLMRREDIVDFPAALRCHDGTIKHVLIHSNGLWEDGHFVHTRCFVRDVSEQRRAEQALLDRNRELRAAIAARDGFLSVAAHELKTPITSLRAFAQLLLRDARSRRAIAPERLEAALATIETQTGNLHRLVERLLDTTQLDGGGLRLVPERTDLAALVRSALTRYPSDGAHPLIFEGPERLEAVVDPERFAQIVGNLVENAVKFSPAGGAVTVALGRDDAGSFRLSVTDQGVGIPADQREAVFERFHQAHGERHLSGLGLGLALTRELAVLHGGWVRVEPVAPAGSRFVVTLPAAVAVPGPATTA